MEVTLTARAEELLGKLSRLGPPERIIEMALERLVADQPPAEKRVTVQQAVDRIRELRKGNTLAGLSVKDLINEGRKY